MACFLQEVLQHFPATVETGRAMEHVDALAHLLATAVRQHEGSVAAGDREGGRGQEGGEGPSSISSSSYSAAVQGRGTGRKVAERLERMHRMVEVRLQKEEQARRRREQAQAVPKGE